MAVVNVNGYRMRRRRGGRVMGGGNEGGVDRWSVRHGSDVGGARLTQGGRKEEGGGAAYWAD
jgi:hypothetical protein